MKTEIKNKRELVDISISDKAIALTGSATIQDGKIISLNGSIMAGEEHIGHFHYSISGDRISNYIDVTSGHQDAVEAMLKQAISELKESVN